MARDTPAPQEAKEAYVPVQSTQRGTGESWRRTKRHSVVWGADKLAQADSFFNTMVTLRQSAGALTSSKQFPVHAPWYIINPSVRLPRSNFEFSVLAPSDRRAVLAVPMRFAALFAVFHTIIGYILFLRCAALACVADVTSNFASSSDPGHCGRFLRVPARRPTGVPHGTSVSLQHCCSPRL